MIRILMIFVLVLAAALLAVQLARQVRSSRVDWNGVAFMAGFVVLAFWLRHVTEID